MMGSHNSKLEVLINQHLNASLYPHNLGKYNGNSIASDKTHLFAKKYIHFFIAISSGKYVVVQQMSKNFVHQSV